MYKQGKIKKVSTLGKKAEVNANFAVTKEGYYMSFPFDGDDDIFMVYDLAIKQIEIERNKLNLSILQNKEKNFLSDIQDVIIWLTILFGLMSITMSIVLIVMLITTDKPKQGHNTVSLVVNTMEVEDELI